MKQARTANQQRASVQESQPVNVPAAAPTETAFANETHVHYTSGAASSALFERYDLIPPVVLERLARRFSLGAMKYGPRQYRKGFADEAFIADRINHIYTHWIKFLQGDESDDNLAGMLWGIAFLMEVQETQSTEVKDAFYKVLYNITPSGDAARC